MTARHELLAQFEILTPMFLGDAKQEASRIREASFKGALAFWWRALNYADYVAVEGDPARVATSLRNRERALFGSTEGQGRFLCNVVDGSVETLRKSTETVLSENGGALAKGGRGRAVPIGPGARYLGYGLIDAFDGKCTKAGRLQRDCFKAGGSFSVRMLFRRGSTDRDVDEICAALKLLGLIGGLGSRVRRGYGSLALRSLEGSALTKGASWSAPASKSDYQAALNTMLVKPRARVESSRDWRLSAFAGDSRCYISKETAGDPVKMLDRLGRALLNYRAWGKGGSVDNQIVQRQFVEDHDWCHGNVRALPVPYRTAFGLPHNYGKVAGINRDVPGGSRPNSGGGGRRGSPMFLHIHKCGEEAFAVVTLLPTLFLPEAHVHLTHQIRLPSDKPSYDWRERYGPKEVSGYGVLLGFVGDPEGGVRPQNVVAFERVF